MKKTWCVEAILRDWLMNHGYDGLCNPDQECWCSLDNFLLCFVQRGMDFPLCTLDERACVAGHLHGDKITKEQKEQDK